MAKRLRDRGKKAKRRDAQFYDGSPTSAANAVFAGHRAGKRKRGVSVQRKTPKDTAHAITRDIVETATGDKVGSVRTITYKRPV